MAKVPLAERMAALQFGTQVGLTHPSYPKRLDGWETLAGSWGGDQVIEGSVGCQRPGLLAKSLGGLPWRIEGTVQAVEIAGGAAGEYGVFHWATAPSGAWS